MGVFLNKGVGPYQLGWTMPDFRFLNELLSPMQGLDERQRQEGT